MYFYDSFSLICMSTESEVEVENVVGVQTGQNLVRIRRSEDTDQGHHVMKRRKKE